MVRAYWWRVIIQAWQQTIRALGFDSLGRVMTAFLTAIIAATGLLFWGSQDAVGDYAIERGVLWGLTFAAFPFVYLWHFVSAPAKLEQEKLLDHGAITNSLTERVTNLELQQKTKQQKQTIALRLSFLLEKGRYILSERIKEDEFDEWKQRYDHWTKKTLVFLRSFLSHQDAANFVMTLTKKEARYEYAINDIHNKLLNVTQIKIEKLEYRLSDYKEYWTTMMPDQNIALEIEFSRPIDEESDIQDLMRPYIEVILYHMPAWIVALAIFGLFFV